MADSANAVPPLRAFLDALAGDYLVWALASAMAMTAHAAAYVVIEDLLLQRR